MIPRSPIQTPIKSRPKHRSKSLILSPTFSKSVNPLPPKMDKPEEQLPEPIKPIPEPIKLKKDNKNILDSSNISSSKKMTDSIVKLVDELIEANIFKQKDEQNIIDDIIKYYKHGYPNDNITKINKFIREKKYGEDINDYINKNRSDYVHYLASTLLSPSVLPSDDPEITDTILSLSQEKRNRQITMKAINNPEQFIKEYEDNFQRL